jgi:hypothetical protein
MGGIDYKFNITIILKPTISLAAPYLLNQIEIIGQFNYYSAVLPLAICKLIANAAGNNVSFLC